jgi:hypothetical protein
MRAGRVEVEQLEKRRNLLDYSQLCYSRSVRWIWSTFAREQTSSRNSRSSPPASAEPSFSAGGFLRLTICI